ncbi:hypothetical protein GCM10009547_48090 [Sporichthya brevicatena]|uniref:Uncharacterized protein n=1 Tax=Sporichthya brevicatena TaxID=171442 RepID=A0ABP3SKA4_9ACTN
MNTSRSARLPAEGRARSWRLLVFFLAAVLTFIGTTGTASAAAAPAFENRVKAFNAALATGVGPARDIAAGQGRGEGLPQLRLAEGRGVHTYYVLAGATPVLVHNCTVGVGRELVPYDSNFLLGQMTAGGRASRSQLEDFGAAQGWVRSQTATGPVKYTDENGITRLTIKQGSARTPGSEGPHVEMRNAQGARLVRQRGVSQERRKPYSDRLGLNR